MYSGYDNLPTATTAFRATIRFSRVCSPAPIISAVPAVGSHAIHPGNSTVLFVNANATAISTAPATAAASRACADADSKMSLCDSDHDSSAPTINSQKRENGR